MPRGRRTRRWRLINVLPRLILRRRCVSWRHKHRRVWSIERRIVVTTSRRFGVDVLSRVFRILSARVVVWSLADLVRSAAYLLSDAAQVAPDFVSFLLDVGVKRISIVFTLFRLHF